MAENLINLGNHNQKNLNTSYQECLDKGIDPPTESEPKPLCSEEGGERLAGWLEDVSNTKVGLGSGKQCDPVQTGQIVNDIDAPNRNVVYRYSKSMRACDEAMQDMFRNLVVIDEDGKAHPVPIVWGGVERAVAAMVQDNVRKDDTLVVDQLVLPMLAITSTGVSQAVERYTYHKALNYMRGADGKPGFTTNEKYERDTVFGVSRGIPIDISYTLYLWTLYIEDMNQLLEQIFTKFSPVAYIRVRGVPWETIVKLSSVANNLDKEKEDKQLRMLKYEFNFTAETYISQPIVRNKAVLKTKIDIYNNVDEKNVTEVIDRIQVVSKELK